jgi:hypothetical protein
VLPFLLTVIAAARIFFRNRTDTSIEVLALRQQVAVLKRKRPKPPLCPLDRLFWTVLRASWSGWQDALVIVKPETVVAWHRAGFRWYWRWKSRPRGGRPRITEEVRCALPRFFLRKNFLRTSGQNSDIRLPIPSAARLVTTRLSMTVPVRLAEG